VAANFKVREEFMYRTILCAAAGAAIFAIPAKADETVKCRHVHQLASSSFQIQQVGDADGHALNIFRLPGMAFFPDGSVGTSLVIGTGDFTRGIGSTNSGYYTVSFPDGSALWLKFTGTNNIGANSKVPTGKGTAIVIGGTGRYAGAKGEGTFETVSTTGPDPYQSVDNVINIKK
jgi:hypothetical protein